MNRAPADHAANSTLSKRSVFASTLRDCIHKLKGLCRAEDHSARHCRPSRNQRTARQPSDTFDSMGKRANEVIITAGQKEEKQKEYENDLRRMESLRKVRLTNPEQYQMGCMLLKWYFENKTRRPRALYEETPPLELSAGDDVNENQCSPTKSYCHLRPRASNPAPKQRHVGNTSRLFKDPKERRQNASGVFVSKLNFGESGESPVAGFERGTQNDTMLEDLLNMIDDYIDDTTTIVTSHA